MLAYCPRQSLSHVLSGENDYPKSLQAQRRMKTLKLRRVSEEGAMRISDNLVWSADVQVLMLLSTRRFPRRETRVLSRESLTHAIGAGAKPKVY